MTRTLAIAFALVLLAAGCDGNGAQEAGPVPTAPASGASSTGGKTAATTTEASTSTSEAAPPTALCSDRTAAVKVASQEGAAGTIRTAWRVRNTSQNACHTRGYPGMDFQASSGWLDVQVHRGGYPDIDEPPAPVVLSPGQSLRFVSYWGDVGNSGPCDEFDRVKVTLPDNTVSAKVASSGCLNPDSVHVGPVTK